MQLYREAPSRMRLEQHDSRPLCIDSDLNVVAMQMNNRGPVGAPGDLDRVAPLDPNCLISIAQSAVFDAQFEAFGFLPCPLCSG